MERYSYESDYSQFLKRDKRNCMEKVMPIRAEFARLIFSFTHHLRSLDDQKTYDIELNEHEICMYLHSPIYGLTELRKYYDLFVNNGDLGLIETISSIAEKNGFLLKVDAIERLDCT
jgi:hypothetical protein